MGNTTSTSIPQQSSDVVNTQPTNDVAKQVTFDASQTAAPATTVTESSGSSLCPMRLLGPSSSTTKSACPISGKTATPEAPAAVSVHNTPPPASVSDKSVTTAPPTSCPVQYRNGSQFNVYSQKIDPANMMPATANQQAAPNQAIPLDTERIVSSIPKGGTDQTWVYPSPQMFWNALVRKQKVDGASEEDMSTVVAVHNNMNESTWRQVLSWEQLHADTFNAKDTGRDPKLLRFIGRPDEFSPKARLKMFFGHTAPFDRHDWVVDRGGEEVRYIIDYYHDESGVTQDKTPTHMHDFNSMKSIVVDVRPALDSVGAVVDRVIRMPALKVVGKTEYSPPPFFPPTAMAQAEARKLAELKGNWEQIVGKCEPLKKKLALCSSVEECGSATIALQRCTGQVVCPAVVEDFDKCLKADPVDHVALQASFKSIEKCLEMFRLDCVTYQDRK